MTYNLELSAEDFLILVDKSITENDLFIPNLLLYTLNNNPALIREMLAAKVKKPPYQLSTSYIDVLLSKMKFDWVETLMTHPYFKELLLPILDKKTKRIIEDKNITFLSQIERIINNPLPSNKEEEFDSDYSQSVQNLFAVFSDQLIQLSRTNKKEIEKFLNLSIERKTSNHNVPYTKPLIFLFLHIFENRITQLQNLDIINWHACDSEGSNILFTILDYAPPLMQIILANATEDDWAIKNKYEKNAVWRLAETDFTKYKNVSRLHYILENKLVNFDGYNSEYRLMLKRTIKSYNLISNSIELKEKILQVFLNLVSNALINSVEGKDALLFLNGPKVDAKKNKDLINALLYNKLNNNLPQKSSLERKNKI